MRRMLVAVALALTAACSGPQSSSSADHAAPGPASTEAMPMTQAADSAAAPARPSPAPGAPSSPVVPTATASLPMLAYSYTQSLEAPNDRVAALMRRHEQVCVSAGPSVCQVFGGTLSTDRENGAVRGTLNLRARPDWLAGFRATLEQDARGAGGRVLSSGTTTEDLTRSIVDSEATLRAQTTLRDRLQSLLTTRSGPLADVLQIETELARVQGQIDSVQSELSVMRTRVATSALTVNYASETVAVGEGTFAPLSDAMDSFVGNLVKAIAVMIVLASVLLPLALVAGLIAWLVVMARRRGWMKRRPRNAPTSPLPTS